MVHQPRVLLIGNIKEDGSRSMHIYLDYLISIKPFNLKILKPSTKIKPSLYKIFVYPFLLPKNEKVYHILDHSYSYLINFLPKDRTVITCHDLIPLVEKSTPLRAKLLFRFYIHGLKKAKKIITDSENTKKDLVNLLGITESKITVIPPISINQKKFKVLSKSKMKKKYALENKFVLISVGSIFYKNTLLILKAVNKLREKYSQITLLKIGKFSPREREYIEKNGLEKNVIEKNGTSEEELVELYNASDLLVFPSLYEGFGIPPLEAMACEIPVISSNISSLPEVVGHAGILINPYSEMELVRAIISLKNNLPLRDKLIKRGLLNLKRFEKTKIRNELKKIYSEI